MGDNVARRVVTAHLVDGRMTPREEIGADAPGGRRGDPGVCPYPPCQPDQPRPRAHDVCEPRRSWCDRAGLEIGDIRKRVEASGWLLTSTKARPAHP